MSSKLTNLLALGSVTLALAVLVVALIQISPGISPNSTTTPATVALNNTATTTPAAAPIALLFAVPEGAAAPTLTSVTDTANGSVAYTAPSALNQTLSAGQDLYSAIGCPVCDNSLSFARLAGAAGRVTGKTVNLFNLYQANINQTLAAQAVDDVAGAFAPGTVIVPLGIDGNTALDANAADIALIPPSGNIARTASVVDPPALVVEPTMLVAFSIAVAVVVALRRCGA